MNRSGPAAATWRQTTTGLLTRARLFAISYAPLAVIFACRAAPDWPVFAGWMVLAGLALADAFRLVHGRTRALGSRPVILTDVRAEGGAVSGYLATYLLPFLSSTVVGPGDVAAYAVYLLIALVIYVHSDLALVNPTLYSCAGRSSPRPTAAGGSWWSAASLRPSTPASGWWICSTYTW